MHIQYFPNRRSGRSLPLGVQNHTAYFYVETNSFFEFYTVDVRFPCNWHLIRTLDRTELSYAFPTLSPDAHFIYVLFLRMTDDVTFAVQRFDLIGGKEDLFVMNTVEELYRVFEVPLDNIKIRCGANGQLVLFDRTIVQGEIPCWTIRLREETKSFLVVKNSIGMEGDNSERNSSLFTIAVDPINRCFARLMGSRTMLVYTEERSKWVEYVIPAEETLQEIFGTDGFPVEDNRGIRETFGTHGHRVGAMQTRLTFHDLGGVVVARVLHTDRLNTTALVEFDHEKREIRVRKLATFNLDDTVAKMFYLMASSDLHVFLGVRHNAVVYIKCPTLEEMSGWRIQKMLLKNGHIEEVCHISNISQLLGLSFATYSGNEEDEKAVKESLKILGIKNQG